MYAPKTAQRKDIEAVDKALTALLDGLESAVRQGPADNDW